jgi:hypothetical protein
MLQNCLTPTINNDSKFACLEVGVLGASCACLLKVVGKFLVWHLKIELKSRVTPEEWGVPEITAPRQGYLPILLNLHDLDSGVANPRGLVSRKWKVNWYACVHSDACLPLIFWLYGTMVSQSRMYAFIITVSHSVQSNISREKNCRGRRACIASINFTSNLEIIPTSLAFTYVWQY